MRKETVEQQTFLIWWRWRRCCWTVLWLWTQIQLLWDTDVGFIHVSFHSFSVRLVLCRIMSNLLCFREVVYSIFCFNRNNKCWRKGLLLSKQSKTLISEINIFRQPRSCLILLCVSDLLLLSAVSESEKFYNQRKNVVLFYTQKPNRYISELKLKFEKRTWKMNSTFIICSKYTWKIYFSRF